MKFFPSILIVLLTISCGAAAAEINEMNSAREPARNDVVHAGDLLVAATGLNFRTGPSRDASIIRRAKKDEVLYRLSNHHENGYIKVQLEDGKEVWVHRDFTQLIAPSTPATKSTDAAAALMLTALNEGFMKAKLEAECPKTVTDGGGTALADPQKCRAEINRQLSVIKDDSAMKRYSQYLNNYMTPAGI